LQRIVRSTRVAESVKSIHDHTCQACDTRLTAGDRGYSEAAHIKALGGRHKGPDVPSNVLCLCPNCHVLSDIGALLIDEDLTVTVNGKPTGTLRVHQRHKINSQHLGYHRSIHP